MIYEHHESALDGYLQLDDDFAYRPSFAFNPRDLIHILWNDGTEDASLLVDGAPLVLRPRQMTTLNFFHQLEPVREPGRLIRYSFNRGFYCIYDHDAEVSCAGVLFFGTRGLPLVDLDEAEERSFRLLHQVFIEEFGEHDSIQAEMLRMLLKRLIIKLTRLARRSNPLHRDPNERTELIRRYTMLVDVHFKQYKAVGDYAALLFKSPKTIANTFSKYGQATPLGIIHDRVVLEARRLLRYTDKPVAEIADELGYSEPATFYKLFRKHVGTTPAQFRAGPPAAPPPRPAYRRNQNQPAPSRASKPSPPTT